MSKYGMATPESRLPDFTDFVRRRHHDLHMGMAGLGQRVGHGLERQGWQIALPAQVGKENRFQVGPRNFRKKLRRMLIGQMALPSDDALLEMPRTVRMML